MANKRKERSGIDLRDVMGFVGLLLMGAGLWLFEPWISLTVIGAILFLLGMLWSL